MNPADVKTFFRNHWTVRKYKSVPMPEDHLDAILYAAQRAPTDATAQMYTFIRLTDSDVRQQMADLTRNAHINTASESFVICADIHRLESLLKHRGYTPGNYPAVAVHFAVGDAVMAAQNMLIAAEMLGYMGCWIGGVMNNLPEITRLLKLPEGVFPFAALTIGVPDEEHKLRPRLDRALVVHENSYQDPTPEALSQAFEEMAAITSRGDWALSLSRYFAQGGSMEVREGHLRQVLHQQGFAHVSTADQLFQQAVKAGFPELVVRQKGAADLEAWLDQGHLAYRGDGGHLTEALENALMEALKERTE
ncbi:nitroreductase family protein [Deinococcus cellulosilyticus]|uniref:NADPH-dependent oxidoreductase n=1 Tax=Deinococcus cellulosilyticus (strain DSM 18568 / NBRC 106333 / KACC 11606 / 5516J-15) TaxID=1223518 RepID=A0A511N3M3_DEIC1|nr:nitroreductase family protein [Deinococcus cellulosilyticus]GEM47474.1 NADPH-dependent oxidoreductase [Deinococcus cellulosilyticus NBRC 106333 = KACC 11606]